LGNFAVTVDFANTSAVVSVRGEIDRLSSEELGAILDAVIEGHRSIVLDLADSEFINSWGLEAIAVRASRLRQLSGSLTIRSPSAAVERMFDMTAAPDPAHSEPRMSHRRLGAEQSVETYVVSTGVPPFNTTFPADADVVAAALRLVVALARATVRGADGVSVSLRRHGKLATVAASDQTISDMDACQYATGEGPCVDASVRGRWFHAESLGTETRWPSFTPKAQALGINAILSSPLLAEDEPVGALNIYSRSAMAFAPEAQQLASMFASEASLLLGTAGVVVTDEQFSARLGDALRLRRIIAQAEGVIMEREGVRADQAYRILCDLSRQSNQPLRGHAQSVAASTERPRLESKPAPTGRHRG
jgi:anti-anti-sigma factor